MKKKEANQFKLEKADTSFPKAQEGSGIRRRHVPTHLEITHETQDHSGRQVFIDLDDAYGLPFSSTTFFVKDR